MHTNLDNQTVLLAIVAISALAVLLQAFVLLAILFALRKLAKTLQNDVEEMRATVFEVRAAVLPILDNSRQILTNLTPRIEAVATDVSELVYRLRAQATEIQFSTNEILERVRVQSSRVDSMLTRALDTADRAGAYVADSVVKPMRQVSGILASVKAVMGVLRSSGPARRPSR